MDEQVPKVSAEVLGACQQRKGLAAHFVDCKLLVASTSKAQAYSPKSQPPRLNCIRHAAVVCILPIALAVWWSRNEMLLLLYVLLPKTVGLNAEALVRGLVGGLVWQKFDGVPFAVAV